MKKLSFLLSFGALLAITKARSMDDIDRDLTNVATFKVMRAKTNQTQAKEENSLNLPANASSIRENITDTFSCENRTYGYYADVDNDCQIFHVCLPSQTTSGRNITYKWSFICPNETIFNQEVLVCTRPIDSIPCEESEMYYGVNDEFGKMNKTEDNKNNSTEQGYNSKEQDKVQMKPNNPNKETENVPNNNKETNTNQNKNQRRKPSRKQSIIAENDIKKEKLQTMESYDISIENNQDRDSNIAIPETEDVKEVLPVMVDAVIESEPSSFEDMAEIPIKDMLESARLVAERSLRWKKKERRESRRRSLM